MKRIICIAALLVLGIGNLKAQYNFSKIDAWLSANAGQMGGRAILVVYHHGKLVYTGIKSDMQPGQKMIANMIAKRMGKPADVSDYTYTTRQMIASCSKWLSAALVMTFVDEGKLRLEDTVGKYLPVLSKAGKGNITISQCLSHLTAVKAPPLKQDLSEMRSMQSMDDAMQNIAALPMEGKPGTVFRYSNVGLQIAGAVIEKISGKSFETLFAERIAAPLDMKDTDFGHGKVALPAGGASSTPGDYLNFLVMILNHGIYNGKRILSEKSISEMQTDRITADVKTAYSPPEAGDAHYGYGEWLFNGTLAQQHSAVVASPGLFGSFPLVSYSKNYAAFLMTFYLKSDGRNERYHQLVKLIDEAVN